MLYLRHVLEEEGEPRGELGGVLCVSREAIYEVSGVANIARWRDSKKAGSFERTGGGVGESVCRYGRYRVFKTGNYRSQPSTAPCRFSADPLDPYRRGLRFQRLWGQAGGQQLTDVLGRGGDAQRTASGSGRPAPVAQAMVPAIASPEAIGLTAWGMGGGWKR